MFAMKDEFYQSFDMRLIFNLTILVLIPMFLASGCASNNQDNEDQSESRTVLEDMEREVMEVHDAVMPKTADMSALRQRLNVLAESAAASPVAIAQITEANLKLAEADSLMWAWMYGYQRPEEEEEHPDSVREYLRSELEKIESVRDKMLESIDHAQSVIRQLQPDEN